MISREVFSLLTMIERVALTNCPSLSFTMSDKLSVYAFAMNILDGSQTPSVDLSQLSRVGKNKGPKCS